MIYLKVNTFNLGGVLEAEYPKTLFLPLSVRTPTLHSPLKDFTNDFWIVRMLFPWLIFIHIRSKVDWISSLLQGAHNELHLSKNSAVVKSPKVSSLHIFLGKQDMLVKISNKSHFHINLSFMSTLFLFIAKQSRSPTENHRTKKCSHQTLSDIEESVVHLFLSCLLYTLTSAYIEGFFYVSGQCGKALITRFRDWKAWFWFWCLQIISFVCVIGKSSLWLFLLPGQLSPYRKTKYCCFTWWIFSFNT